MTTPPLIDQHGNHREQHGQPIHHVSRYTARGAERHSHAQVLCTSVRESRRGELPLVVLKQLNHPAYTYTDMTPDDADQLADALKQAAQRARDVADALHARWEM